MINHSYWLSFCSTALLTNISASYRGTGSKGTKQKEKAETFMGCRKREAFRVCWLLDDSVSLTGSTQDVNQSIYEHITMKQLPSFDNPIGVLGRQQRNPELLLWDVDLLRLDGHQLLANIQWTLLLGDDELFCFRTIISKSYWDMLKGNATHHADRIGFDS